MKKDSTKFRRFITSSGKLVLAGKSAEQNENVIKQAGKEEIIIHTREAGSPFCNIKETAEKEDIREAAVFCARYSRDWKLNQKDVEVHIFKGKDIYKSKEMKTGTFGVNKFKPITVKKGEIIKFIEVESKGGEKEK